jgi:hypothetical protein
MDGVKERPILFSAPMVRAILEGRKTQTRRVVKPQPSPSSDSVFLGTDGIWRFSHPTLRGPVSHEADDVRCPYGHPGDRLWVRETWGYRCTAWHGAKPDTHTHTIEYQADGARIDFDREINDASGLPKQRKCRADEDYQEYYRDYLTRYWKAWRPSIHMPRWAGRILLEVVSVRVERLQDISEADAMAEGIRETGDGAFHVEGDTFRAPDASESYARLWESINGPGSWDTNPWVWVVEFKRIGGAA